VGTLAPELLGEGAAAVSKAEVPASVAGVGIRANAAQGAALEAKVGAMLARSSDVVAPQVTVRTASGIRTRIDFVTKATAPLTPNQVAAFPEIAESGATVVGKGKPGVPGGTQIPPTEVEIRRL
jgi:filamentous hemagglutinin